MTNSLSLLCCSKGFSLQPWNPGGQVSEALQDAGGLEISEDALLTQEGNPLAGISFLFLTGVIFAAEDDG